MSDRVRPFASTAAGRITGLGILTLQGAGCTRKMKAWLLGEGVLVSRKRVRRMRLMDLEAIPSQHQQTSARTPDLSLPVEGSRVDQVWAADITYIPMAQGFLYLVAIRHSRPGLETLQHHGHRLLYGGVGGSSRQGPTGDIQQIRGRSSP